MTTIDGGQTPDNMLSDDAPHSALKRKRTDSIEAELDPDTTASRQHVFDDILAILYQSEVGPSLLNLPIPQASVSPRASKRSKATAQSSPKSISQKVAERSYIDLYELDQDVADLCDTLISELKRPSEGSNTTFKRLVEEDVAQIQDYMSFRSTVRELVRHECDDDGEIGRRKAKGLNGIKIEDSIEDSAPKTRTVLSLYGNAPTAKQLFSSLQDDAATDLTLEELGLPAMLTATELLPLQNDPETSQKTNVTFHDVFPSPSTLPPLQPPKAPRPTSTKNPSIAFALRDQAAPKASKKASYPHQPLSVASWTGYGSMYRKLSSRSSDRARDRSSSVADHEHERTTNPSMAEDHMFFSAYSSFAPCRDSSLAVLSIEARNQVWWQRSGRRRYAKIFESEDRSDRLEVNKLETSVYDSQVNDQENEMFSRVVEDFDEDLNKVELENEKSLAELDNEELLTEINSLLQTLSSYQRIRHSLLPSQARTPSISSPIPMRAITSGSCAEPTQDENESYQALKVRLAELISRLPPYLVSKKDGNQIDDLVISTIFLLENKNLRGVLEEDHLTRLTKATAAAAASRAENHSRVAQNSQGQYSRSGSITGRSTITPQANQGLRPSASYGRVSSALTASTPISQMNNRAYSRAGSKTAPVGRTQTSLQSTNYGPQSKQPSPRPATQRWANQYGSSQSQQFTNPVYRHTTYSTSSQAVHQRDANGQLSTGHQQRPTSNGRNTPVSNIAPAPPRTHTPVKTVTKDQQDQQNGGASSSHPLAQTNGVQTNGR